MGELEEVVRKDGKNRDCPPSRPQINIILLGIYILLLINNNKNITSNTIFLEK